MLSRPRYWVGRNDGIGRVRAPFRVCIEPVTPILAGRAAPSTAKPFPIASLKRAIFSAAAHAQRAVDFLHAAGSSEHCSDVNPSEEMEAA